MFAAAHHITRNPWQVPSKIYRYVIIVCTALLTTLLIVSLMERLIRNDAIVPVEANPIRLPPVIMEANPTIPVLPPPVRPEPAEKEPPIPQFEQHLTTTVDIESRISPPTVTTAVDDQTYAMADSAAMPIVRIAPDYPRRAVSRGIEGYVDLIFDISPAGYPVNIRILQSEPTGMFDHAATRALSRWKYRPKHVDGSPVTQYNQSTRIRFDLSG